MRVSYTTSGNRRYFSIVVSASEAEEMRDLCAISTPLSMQFADNKLTIRNAIGEGSTLVPYNPSGLVPTYISRQVKHEQRTNPAKLGSFRMTTVPSHAIQWKEKEIIIDFSLFELEQSSPRKPTAVPVAQPTKMRARSFTELAQLLPAQTSAIPEPDDSEETVEDVIERVNRLKDEHGDSLILTVDEDGYLTADIRVRRTIGRKK